MTVENLYIALEAFIENNLGNVKIPINLINELFLKILDNAEEKEVGESKECNS